MAIQWGSYADTGAGFRYRTGLDVSYSPTSISSSTTSVTVTTKIYIGGDTQSYGTGGRYTLTGDESYDVSGVDWSVSSGGYDLLATYTETVSLSYTSTKTFSVTGRIQPSQGALGSGWTPSKTVSISIPKRPYAKPAAPSGVATNRISDTQMRTTWTRNSTTGAPYEGQHVARQTDGGSLTTISTSVSGSATSFDDTKTSLNRRYRYAVRSTNTGGTSGWTYGGYVYTTPNPPAAPSVAKLAGGTIRISRPAAPNAYVDQWRIIHIKDGVRQSTVLNTQTSLSDSWDYTTADVTATHAFRVQYRAPNGLWSADSASSATIELEAPPLMPSQPNPTGTVNKDVATVRFVWKHNPVDSTAQTAYEFGWRAAGGTWSTSGKVLSGQSYRDQSVATWAEASEWRVRTWGAHANPGPYTDPIPLTPSSLPVVTVELPATTATSKITTTVSYYDPEGSAMSRWEALLLLGGAVVDTRSGFGEVTSFSFSSRAEDGQTYVVKFRAADGAGLWSAWDEASTAVSYPLPVPAEVVPTWDREGGTVTLEVSAPAPVAPQVAAVSISVYRQTESGRWRLVAEGLQSGGVVVDNVAPTNTDVVYRAVGVSSLGSTQPGAEASVNTKTPYAFLNYGEGFTQQVRLWASLEATRSHSRDKELQYFEGRTDGLPVPYVGEDRSVGYDLSAARFGPWVPERMPSSTWAELEALSDTVSTVCLRDPEGVRLFVSVAGVDLSGHLKGRRGIRLPLTVVGYDEGEEILL